jgi:hypothetical protein
MSMTRLKQIQAVFNGRGVVKESIRIDEHTTTEAFEIDGFSLVMITEVVSERTQIEWNVFEEGVEGAEAVRHLITNDHMEALVKLTELVIDKLLRNLERVKAENAQVSAWQYSSQV